MEDKEKVTILLAEYNTLRSEVLAARVSVAQALGIGVPVMAAAIGTAFANATGHRNLFLTLAALMALFIIFTLTWNEMGTRNFTARIRELEADINKRVGERLLTWESDHGWGGLVTWPNRKK